MNAVTSPSSPESQFREIARMGVFALTALRAVLAPYIVILAIQQVPGWAFIACLTVAFLSDILDGVLARRFGVATPVLRRFDSITDTMFYVAVTCAAWLIHPSAIRSNLVGIAILVGLELTRYSYDLMKFGREASYHTWSAKLWGIALFAAFMALLGFGTPVLVPVAILVGIIADLEGLAASMIFREWTHDVPSVFHAWSVAGQLPRARRKQLQPKADPP